MESKPLNVHSIESFGVITSYSIHYTKLYDPTTLCNDEVRGVCIDDEGRKWFATSQGISVYDGTNWETYSTHTGLKSDAFYCIAKDSKGTIWVGSHNT